MFQYTLTPEEEEEEGGGAGPGPAGAYDVVSVELVFLPVEAPPSLSRLVDAVEDTVQLIRIGGVGADGERVRAVITSAPEYGRLYNPVIPSGGTYWDLDIDATTAEENRLLAGSEVMLAGVVLYQPAANFVGGDSFAYAWEWREWQAEVWEVQVTVRGSDDPPVVEPIDSTVAPGGTCPPEVPCT
jgi:hypothetical protein